MSIPTFDKTHRDETIPQHDLEPGFTRGEAPLQEPAEELRTHTVWARKEGLEWTEGLDIKKAAAEEVEYLYWVGCVASLDDRNRKVARSVATILNKAGVSFGILGADEICCGDPLRRTGNEYQYQENAQSNIEMFKELGIKKIVTACPHCYNTLKNDYAQLGNRF